MDFYVLAAQVLPGLLIAIMLELRSLIKAWEDEQQTRFAAYLELQGQREPMFDLKEQENHYMEAYGRSYRAYELARWSSVFLAVLFVLGEGAALIGARYDLGDGWLATSVQVVVWSALAWLGVLAATYPVRMIWAHMHSYQEYRLIHLRALRDHAGAKGHSSQAGLAAGSDSVG